MGFYVNVYAKNGCEEQINDLWACEFPDSTQLIATKEWIQGEIEFIKNDPEQRHMTSWLKTVSDWNKGFPIYAEGRGQVFIGSAFVRESDNYSEPPDVLKGKITWLMNHRFLFSEISGLGDAVDALDMDISFDAIENGRPVNYEYAAFDKLPVMPKSQVYRTCVEHSRPEFWEKYLDFKASPCWDTWNELRHKIIPSQQKSTGRTVWQECEAFAMRLDGKDHGLTGRYRDGHFPEEWMVERAIRANIGNSPSLTDTMIEEARLLSEELLNPSVNDKKSHLSIVKS